MKRDIFIILISLFILISCKKKCEYDSYPTIEPCESNEVCESNIQVVNIINTAFSYTSEYVIYNDSTYNVLKSIDTVRNIDWPIIDFTKSMLVGKYSESTGCKLKTTYKLLIVGNKYLLRIRNISYGNCDILHIKTDWLIVPKIDSAEIVFEIINNQC